MSKGLPQTFVKLIRNMIDKSVNARKNCIKAKVISFNTKKYTLECQPCRNDGTVDNTKPPLMDAEFSPIWGGPNRGVYCIPPPGTMVRIGFYNGDPNFPYVDAVLLSETIPANNAEEFLIVFDETKFLIQDGVITIETASGKAMILNAGGPLVVTGSKQISINAESIVNVSTKTGTIYLKTQGGNIFLHTGTGAKGVVLDCDCAYTGNPHPGVSKTVQASE